MNIIEAILAMRNGKAVKRAIWNEYTSPQYLELVNCCYFFSKPSEITVNAEYFSINDIEANDWEVIEA